MTLALTVAVLTAGGMYLLLQREMLRLILGFVLLGHAANLIIISAGGADRRGMPFGTPDDPGSVADPLPQAFVLTAIVIAFSITIVMLVLSATGSQTDDTTDDDPEPDFTEIERRVDAERLAGAAVSGQPTHEGHQEAHA